MKMKSNEWHAGWRVGYISGTVLTWICIFLGRRMSETLTIAVAIVLIIISIALISFALGCSSIEKDTEEMLKKRTKNANKNVDNGNR